jgi:molybdenum cofactor synthesis domain-containing protein
VEAVTVARTPHDPGAEPPLAAAVITCSDSVAAGRAEDRSGPLAASLLADLGHAVTGVAVVPDDLGAIGAAVRRSIDHGARIVVLTGGTGAGPRDVTPEALRALGLRELPGLGEAIRAGARATVPAADLSRALGGALGGAAVLALPGSPGGVRDGLAAVGGLLAHAAAVAGAHGSDGPATAPPASHDPFGLSAHVAPQPEWITREGVGAPVREAPDALVRAAPLTEAEVVAEVTRRAAGAVVTFAGVVRDHDGGRGVTALYYEGHPTAGGVLAEIVAGAHQRPGVLAAAARHRVGDLAIGELAFVVAVSAAHRREAFEACAWLVDEAKARLPIWKQQHFDDGSDEWVHCP